MLTILHFYCYLKTKLKLYCIKFKDSYRKNFLSNSLHSSQLHYGRWYPLSFSPNVVASMRFHFRVTPTKAFSDSFFLLLATPSFAFNLFTTKHPKFNLRVFFFSYLHNLKYKEVIA